jgi:hypothetical protein
VVGVGSGDCCTVGTGGSSWRRLKQRRRRWSRSGGGCRGGDGMQRRRCRCWCNGFVNGGTVRCIGQAHGRNAGLRLNRALLVVHAYGE